MESIESQKIEVGDIFSTTERGVENKPLIMVANIICDGEPGSKVVNSSWGTRHYNSDGCSLNYKVSLDNGETWNYEDGEGHYVDTGWIGELVKMGRWSLLQKNINFFDGLTESEDEFEWVPDQGEIGLKARVNGKNFFIKNPIYQQDNGMFTKIIHGWNGCYEIIGEEIFTGVDCYIVELSVDYPEVYFPKKVFLEKDFCGIDDTSNRLFESEESEENYEWLEDLGSETFQNVLIKNNPRIPHLSDDIDIIMFNPPVAIGDKRFNKIAYWLEDEDYYPEILEEYNIKTSYIEITRHKDDRQNGRWKIGPELNEQELYNLSQTPKHPNWNCNFWEEEVLQVI